MTDNPTYPELPERFGDAAINDPTGFKDHPDWQRRGDRKALIHRSGWVYHGVVDGREVWTRV